MVNAQTKAIDVINHPLFNGFGKFLFPVRHGISVASMNLADIGCLLPYHSNIHPDTTVTVVNYLLQAVSQGTKVFYDIYTEEEKIKNPSKKDTGLFFFRGNPKAPFAIISAGGGFSYVGSIHESFPHALELSKRGYNAFVLQYRTGGADVACEDLAAAISFVFSRREELGVDTDCYSLWGGSAGARMAAYVGSYSPAAFGGDDLPRPGAVIMQYTGHTDYTRQDPPTFVVVGEKDGIVSWQVMKRRVDALNKYGVPTEFHLYKGLGHGFGLGIGTSAEGWINKAIAFWEAQMPAK